MYSWYFEKGSSRVMHIMWGHLGSIRVNLDQEGSWGLKWSIFKSHDAM